MFPSDETKLHDVARSDRHALLHGSESLRSGQTLEVVAVLRRCRACGEQKLLEHFLLHNRTTVIGDVKVCAACRARVRAYVRTTPRHLGRYVDLPLDDWAEAR